MTEHHCTQEKTLGEHASTLEHIAKTLERFVTVAEKIAAQGERIIKLEKDSEIAFARLREIEMAPGKESQTVKHNIILALATVAGSFIVAFFTKR